MPVRVYVVGLGAGLLLIALLYYPLRQVVPDLVLQTALTAGTANAVGLVVVSGVLLLGTGAVAARLSGAFDRRGAFRAGATAGLIAMLLAEVWLGGAAAGVWGAQNLLRQTPATVANQQALMGLLAEAVISVHWWTELSAWAAALIGVGLGGLGGAIAGPSGIATRRFLFLGPVLALVGTLVVTLNAALSTYVFLQLGPAVQQAATEANQPLPFPADTPLLCSLVSALCVLGIWQVAGWWAARRVHPTTYTEYRSLQGIIWATGILPLGLAGVIGWLSFSTLGVVSLISIGLALVLGCITLWNLRALDPRPAEPGERFGEPLFYALSTALGGAILFVQSYLLLIAALLNLTLLIGPTGNLLAPATIARPTWLFGQTLAPSATMSDIIANTYSFHQQIALLGTAAIIISTILLTGLMQLLTRLTAPRS